MPQTSRALPDSGFRGVASTYSLSDEPMRHPLELTYPFPIERIAKPPPPPRGTSSKQARALAGGIDEPPPQPTSPLPIVSNILLASACHASSSFLAIVRHPPS
ncbi:Os07g0515532 [Oryza sativa Japonica Group]|uniref:Os07g0515532 protein n=1 Tax=Oryza sativa subsp. japonica TaxID=39947 RepID=A0A0P0X6S5_ORYSJ|nr:Os07g0515532 [Oryza sativa Japonica Group]